MSDDVEILELEPKKKPSINKKSHRKKLTKYTKMLLIIDAFAVICFFLAYGPIRYFRDALVTNALTSMSHQYFAYVLYNEKMIDKVVKQNMIIESDDSTDTSAIKITQNTNQDSYESVYEEQILKKDKDNDLYKLIKIEQKTYTAFITVVYDPSRVELVSSKKLSSGGQFTSKIAKDNKAIIAVNGGGFKYSGTVMRPKGTYIQDGKIIYNSNKKSKLIAMNNDNILVLTQTTAKNAIASGIRDAVEFGPYLIVNGKAAEYKGDGGYGNRPRTAIGQRQDGIILFVTIDGKSGLTGTTMKELTNIFIRYKAYNAANLDGGGSSALVINNKLINEPVSWNHGGERRVCNAWIVK